jgi:uncharacterized protein (DUF2141 family)
MTEIPQPLAAEVWKVAGSVKWTCEDWKDFYHSLTALFARISARHAKRMIDATEPVPMSREEIDKIADRVTQQQDADSKAYTESLGLPSDKYGFPLGN